MVNVVPQEVPRPKSSGPAARGFWPWDIPRHSIHYDTSSAISNNVPVCKKIYINPVFLMFKFLLFLVWVLMYLSPNQKLRVRTLYKFN